MALIVATERLGSPGRESGWLERAGFVQKRQHYPTDRDAPTATCHLQPADDRPALCGYPWEALVAVPGQPEWSDLDEWLRCDRCDALRAVE
jgi:hypothetical protein